MKKLTLKNTFSALGLALAVLIGVSDATAQNRGQLVRQHNQIIKQQQKIQKQNLKLEKQRLKLERERLEALQAQNNRYRINRGGQWFTVDHRQAELLRQAVNEGYRQGFTAGRSDRYARRTMSWNNSGVYRSATYGYQSYVNRSLYQHYFQQGFERGYQDGFNSRNQFGTGSGGNILGAILQGILGLQRF